MVQLIHLLSIFALSSMSMAAPASGGVTITVKNNCGYNIQVSQLTNDESSAGKASDLAGGASKQYNVPSNWGGRFWGRKECSGGSTDCLPGEPASLAEFLLKGSSGQDFYDVSFVDGYNLPMSISPNGAKEKTNDGQNECVVLSCSKLPSCPKEFVAKDSKGNVIGCKSACAASRSDENCCLGSFNSPDTCKTNSYASVVKAACPNVYSFPYDDKTSTFSCQASSYTVNFCPS